MSNRCAAMRPAAFAVSRWANSMGTTIKPMVVSEPHHRARLKSEAVRDKVFIGYYKENRLPAQ
jgi:hypothetical protein